jgi:hypothetical protein
MSKAKEKFKKYIGKSFNTVVCPDIFTIVGVNSNGYVVLSDQNGKHFEYLSVDICLETIKNDSSWIFVDNKELKNPFYLDEHLYNQDLEKRDQAENKGENEKKVVVSSTKEFDFDVEIQSTLQKIKELLLIKGKEYRRNNNPYHNFETGAKMKGITPEKALDGFLLKHIVSYNDMLNDIDSGVLPKIEVVEEKFNDILVYFLIQKAQIINRINNAQ